MRTENKLTLTTLALLAALTASAPQARAWGCVAEGTDGASGWSTSYDRKRDASARAMAECNAKTNESCEITDCNVDW
jgi:hypothetical protein